MFEIMFIIVPIFIICVFLYDLLMLLSPKLRGRVMSRQIKAAKYMVDESKDALTDLVTTTSDVMVKSRKKVLKENEEDLRDISNRTAYIHKDAVTTTAEAIKKGLSSDGIYCKYCGDFIDKDSKFCKSCGRKQ